MRMALRSAPFLLLLWGCRPTVGGPVLPEDSDPPVGPDTADSEPDLGDTETEWIPHGAADPVFDPPAGAFTGTISVTLGSSTGTGAILACTTTPSQTCEPEPYTEPLQLERSSIVLARVDVEGVPGEVQARSYVSVTAEVAAFESNLPVMVFWTDRVAPSSDTIVPLGLDVFEPVEGTTSLGAAATDSGRCRMKTRGSSTSHMTKHSYDLELWQPTSEEDRPVELAGMPADGDWVLYAPYYFDEALIRNALGYALSNRVGRYAPRTAMVELFVAGGLDPVSGSHYAGVYTLTEEIERAGHRVDITPIAPEDVAEPELTGGYLFKRDRAGDGERGFWVGTAGGAFAFDYPLVWVDPEESEISPPQQAYLESQLESLAWSLVQPDFTDPLSGLHYSEIIDVDSWIDHHILNVVFKNPDAFRLSGYMFKEREGLIQAGPMWDLDRTAGAYDSRATYPTWWDASNQTSDTTAVFVWGWYGGLFDDPDFRARYWARWRELLQGELATEAILALVDEQAEPLVEPAARNAARWGSGPFPAEIDALRTWLEARMGWIQDCIDTHEDPRECQGIRSGPP
jgi:hypothetical protein